jgi:hypothetical protein
MTVSYETSRDAPLSVGGIIRDVLIVFALTAVGGFVIGLVEGIRHSGASVDEMVLEIAASNLLLGTIGFTISGCLARGSRWQHLGLVALGVWLLSLINVGMGFTSIVQWFFAAIFVAIMMGAGGALSYLFKR